MDRPRLRNRELGSTSLRAEYLELIPCFPVQNPTVASHHIWNGMETPLHDEKVLHDLGPPSLSPIPAS